MLGDQKFGVLGRGVEEADGPGRPDRLAAATGGCRAVEPAERVGLVVRDGDASAGAAAGVAAPGAAAGLETPGPGQDVHRRVDRAAGAPAALAAAAVGPAVGGDHAIQRQRAVHGQPDRPPAVPAEVVAVVAAATGAQCRWLARRTVHRAARRIGMAPRAEAAVPGAAAAAARAGGAAAGAQPRRERARRAEVAPSVRRDPRVRRDDHRSGVQRYALADPRSLDLPGAVDRLAHDPRALRYRHFPLDRQRRAPPQAERRSVRQRHGRIVRGIRRRECDALEDAQLGQAGAARVEEPARADLAGPIAAPAVGRGGLEAAEPGRVVVVDRDPPAGTPAAVGRAAAATCLEVPRARQGRRGNPDRSARAATALAAAAMRPAVGGDHAVQPERPTDVQPHRAAAVAAEIVAVVAAAARAQRRRLGYRTVRRPAGRVAVRSAHAAVTSAGRAVAVPRRASPRTPAGREGARRTAVALRIGGDRAGAVDDHVPRHGEVQPGCRRGRMRDRPAVQHVHRGERVGAVDRQRGAEDADIVAVVGRIAGGDGRRGGEHRVGVVGVEAEREGVVGLAGQAVPVDVHRVARHVRHVRADRHHVPAAGRLGGEGDLVCVAAEVGHGRGGHVAGGRVDRRVGGGQRGRIDRLGEGDGDAVERGGGQVHGSVGRGGGDTEAGGVQRDGQDGRVGALLGAVEGAGGEGVGAFLELAFDERVGVAGPAGGRGLAEQRPVAVDANGLPGLGGEDVDAGGRKGGQVVGVVGPRVQVGRQIKGHRRRRDAVEQQPPLEGLHHRLPPQPPRWQVPTHCQTGPAGRRKAARRAKAQRPRGRMADLAFLLRRLDPES